MAIAFPGYVSDVNDGDDITEDWGDAIRDRAFQIFTDTTTRDAAIPSPKVGQWCYITSTGSLLQYAGATDGWRQPWNSDWGRIQTATITATSAAFTANADVSGLGATFTAVANRLYVVRFVGMVQSTIAADRIRITLTDGTTTYRAMDADIPAANARVTLNFDADVTGLTAGSKTLKAQAQRVTGTGSCTVLASATQFARVTVDDLGPNGNPA